MKNWKMFEIIIGKIMNFMLVNFCFKIVENFNFPYKFLKMATLANFPSSFSENDQEKKKMWFFVANHVTDNTDDASKKNWKLLEEAEKSYFCLFQSKV